MLNFMINYLYRYILLIYFIKIILFLYNNKLLLSFIGYILDIILIIMLISQWEFFLHTYKKEIYVKPMVNSHLELKAKKLSKSIKTEIAIAYRFSKDNTNYVSFFIAKPQSYTNLSGAIENNQLHFHEIYLSELKDHQDYGIPLPPTSMNEVLTMWKKEDIKQTNFDRDKIEDIYQEYHFIYINAY